MVALNNEMYKKLQKPETLMWRAIVFLKMSNAVDNAADATGNAVDDSANAVDDAAGTVDNATSKGL